METNATHSTVSAAAVAILLAGSVQAQAPDEPLELSDRFPPHIR